VHTVGVAVMVSPHVVLYLLHFLAVRARRQAAAGCSSQVVKKPPALQQLLQWQHHSIAASHSTQIRANGG